MWKTIKQQITLETCDYLFYYLLEIILTVVGIIVMCTMTYFGREDSYFPLGTVISGMVAVIVFLLGAGFSLYMGYNTAVSMGKTRRQFLLGAAPIHFFMIFMGIVIWSLLMRAEFWIYRSTFPSLKEEGTSMMEISPLWAVAAAGLITGAMFLGTAIMRRFKRGRGILLIVWLLLFWGIPGALDKKNSNFILDIIRTALIWVTELSEPVRMGAAMGLGILFAIMGCVLMRRLEVE